MIESEAVDSEILEELRELLQENFSLVLSTYIDDSQRRMVRIHQALGPAKQGDLGALSTEIHGLKGSSRNLGANILADDCEALERDLRAGRLGGLEQQLADLEQDLAAVVAQLAAL